MSSLRCNSTFWVSVSVVGGTLWLLVTQIINYWWEREGTETENRDLGSYTPGPGLGKPSLLDPAWALSFNTSSYWRTSHFPVLCVTLIRWMNKQTCIATELNMVVWAGWRSVHNLSSEFDAGHLNSIFPFWYPKLDLTPTVALFLMPHLEMLGAFFGQRLQKKIHLNCVFHCNLWHLASRLFMNSSAREKFTFMFGRWNTKEMYYTCFQLRNFILGYLLK